MIFPLNLTELIGQYGAWLAFLVIGFAFGYALEISGFGDSPKLARQFYFQEMTVLKVMFTGIIVAMVGVFAASALGLLDYNLVWVNPTYLWPGIIGGLIMGVGFIVGGFCPGTSLVSMATGKIDAVFFVLGVLFGIFGFGETVDYFNDFFYSSYMGRFTLMELFNVEAGWVVLGVVVMALFMFWGSEILEKKVGGMDQSKAPKARYWAAGVLVVIALAILVIGQPTAEDRWKIIASEKEPLLAERAYQIHPGELLGLMHDDKIMLQIFDVRSEADFNLFHISNAKNTPIDLLAEMLPDLLLEPSNAIFVLVSNNEELATEAWKMLVAENLHNVYLLEGGTNFWLDVFSEEGYTDEYIFMEGETFTHEFEAAWGDRHPSADPDPHHFEIIYVPKVKLELKKGPSGGGCG